MMEMTGTAPCFRVRDMAAAIVFYTEKLGFEVRFAVPKSPPPYCVLGRGPVGLHLQLDPDREGSQHCTVFVDDADAWSSACEAAGIEFDRRVEDSPYGLRDFVIRDPEGNTILLGAPIDGAGPTA